MKPDGSRTSNPRMNGAASGSAPVLLAAWTVLVLHVASCSGQNAQNESPQRILAFAGDAVLLPCRVPARAEPPTLEWSKEGLDPRIVFLYRDGCETFEMKNARFQYRTNLVVDELRNGNASLLVSGVRLTDAGTYQCSSVEKKNRVVHGTLEVIVVSEPRVSLVPDSGGAGSVRCEVTCCPVHQPDLTFLGDEGNEIQPEHPTRRSTSHGCCDVSGRVRASAARRRLTCRVSDRLVNKTKDKDVYYIPGDCSHFYSILSVPVVLLILVLVLVSVFLWVKKRVGRKKVEKIPPDPPSDNNQNAQTEQELQKQIDQKDAKIRELTEKLKLLEPRPVVKPPVTIITSPPASPPATGRVPHNDATDPQASAGGSPTEGSSLKPGPNPALGLPLQRRFTVHSPTAHANDGGPASSPAASSAPEKKPRPRSHSGPRSPRRHSFSWSSSGSFNRFSVLQDLQEKEVLLEEK